MNVLAGQAHIKYQFNRLIFLKDFCTYGLHISVSYVYSVAHFQLGMNVNFPSI